MDLLLFSLVICSLKDGCRNKLSSLKSNKKDAGEENDLIMLSRLATDSIDGAV